jgi:hypothetical protein
LTSWRELGQGLLGIGGFPGQKTMGRIFLPGCGHRNRPMRGDPGSEDYMVKDKESSVVMETAAGAVEAVIILGHGSRVPDASRDMEKVADRLREKYGYPVVEICFLSKLGPHFPEILQKCVKLGATRVLVVPYFLHTGMHLLLDIPEMVKEEAEKYPGVSVRMGRGFGFDELLVDLLQERIQETRSSRDIKEMVLPPKDKFADPDGR